MFLFTVTKPGLRQAGALALCAVCLAGTVTAAVRFAGAAVPAAAGAETAISTTQDIAGYFTGYGFEVDLATAAVDEVKVPKRWDDSFTAFNQVVGESGLSLADYKGKTVEKWTVLCPALSDGETDTYCVLLVYKTRPVGAYLLASPSGEVTGLVTAAATAAPLPDEQAAETAAGFGEEAAAPAEDAAAANAPLTEEAAETGGEVSLEDAGAVPIE